MQKEKETVIVDITLYSHCIKESEIQYLKSAQGIEEGAYFPGYSFAKEILQESLPLSGGPTLEPAQDASLLLEAYIGYRLRISHLACVWRRAGQLLEAGRAANTPWS